MSSIEDALRYPMNHDNWIVTVLIGGALSLFSFLVVPILIVYGYLLRVIRSSVDGSAEPPEFGDWGELIVEGFKAAVIGFVYMLIPLIVGAVTVGGSMAAMIGGGRAGAAAGLAGLAVGFLITFVLSLVFGYVAVAAIVHFANEGNIGAGFDFGTLREIMFDRDYAVAWAMSVVVFIGAAIVGGLLNVIPLLGAVVSTFVFFYAQVVGARLWAGGYEQARAGATGGGTVAAGDSAI